MMWGGADERSINEWGSSNDSSSNTATTPTSGINNHSVSQPIPMQRRSGAPSLNNGPNGNGVGNNNTTTANHDPTTNAGLLSPRSAENLGLKLVNYILEDNSPSVKELETRLKGVKLRGEPNEDNNNNGGAGDTKIDGKQSRGSSKQQQQMQHQQVVVDQQQQQQTVVTQNVSNNQSGVKKTFFVIFLKGGGRFHSLNLEFSDKLNKNRIFHFIYCLTFKSMNYSNI